MSEHDRGMMDQNGQRGAMMFAVVIAAVGVLALAWQKWERTVAIDDSARTVNTVARVPEIQLDLNTASVEELSLLPGIGPGLAERIVNHREEHGPFRTVEELDDVRGIGASVMERVRPFVTVDEDEGHSSD